MGLKSIIERLTFTKRLEKSGQYETIFYGSIYRLVYVTGLSMYESSLSYTVYSVFAKSIVVLFAMSEVWFLFADCNDLNDVLETISVTMINVLSICRYCDMVRNISLFKDICASTRSPSFDVNTKGRQELLKKWIKVNDCHFKLLFYLINCTVSIWFFKPLFDDEEYQLFVKMKFPYDYKKPIVYLFTYMIAVIMFIYASYFVMVNDMILQTHLITIVVQFSILNNCFKNIGEDCAIIGKRNALMSGGIHLQRVSARFNDLVDEHNRLFKLTEKLQKVMSIPMLGQLVASLLLICIAGYQLSKAVNSNFVAFLTSLLYLGYNLIELFIFCRWSNEITIQSLSICDAVYSCNWERRVLPSLRGKLQFIIARASKPLVLTAGGIWELSLETYAKIVQKSYSALTVLLQFQRRDS